MPLTPDQCRQWAELPHSTRPGFTIDLVRDAVQGAPRLRWQPLKVYVQGSYANRTYIDKDCDVDLVIQLSVPFEENLAQLDADERELFYKHHEYSEYGWDEFRADLLATFKRSYFTRQGQRCLTLRDWDSAFRVPADILPAIEYRRYRAFPGLDGAVYDEGVFFRAGDRQPIINYPLQHLRNGNRKDAATGGRFKEVVRVAKNARRDDSAGLTPGTAPSYFVECLLYNVEHQYYRADDLFQAYHQVVRRLTDLPDLPSLACQNGIVPMFGTHAEAWHVEKAKSLIKALHRQL